MPELKGEELRALRSFLVRAKKATYAGGGEALEAKFTDGRREFRYGDRRHVYQDTYVGWERFSGQEVVYAIGADDRLEPIWTMVYSGFVLPQALGCAGITTEQVYEFLKAALRRVTQKAPYRGPEVFRQGQFHYECEFAGGLDPELSPLLAAPLSGEGEEQIFYIVAEETEHTDEVCELVYALRFRAMLLM